MKSSSYIRSFAAAVLLLLFTLQAGLGLYLHNAFHQPAAIAHIQQLHKTGTTVSVADGHFSCSCIDNFLVPFYVAAHPAVPQAASQFLSEPQADYYNYLPHSLRIFRSLRAPPVSVS